MIALVALLDSEEHHKIAMIVSEIRRAGHEVLLVDAALFADASLRIGSHPAEHTLTPVLFAGRGLRREVLPQVSGRHRDLEGRLGEIVVADVALLRIGGRPHWLAVDAIWVDCLDIGRRRDFETLYRDLAEHRVPSLAGTWEAVLDATFKDRTLAALDRANPGQVLPHPRTELVTASWSDPAIRSLAPTSGSAGLWVKANDESHSRTVSFVPHGGDLIRPVRAVLRGGSSSRVCLVQEDVVSVVVDPEGQAYRADLAVTVLDRRALQVTLRIQPDRSRPTNSLHGGSSMAVDPDLVPLRVLDLAIRAMAATGNRYGSVDIFGGLVAVDRFTVVSTQPPVVGEINALPGGRSPGFVERVVGPLVQAHVAMIR